MITIELEDFQKAVTACTTGLNASKIQTLLMGYLHISAEPTSGRIVIKSTDNTRTITYPIPAKYTGLTEPLIFTLPCEASAKIAAAAQSDVVIKGVGSTVDISSGRSKWKIATVPSDDYPRFHMPDSNPKTVTVKASLLMPLLSWVSVAVASGSPGKLYSNVVLSEKDCKLYALGTNGAITLRDGVSTDSRFPFEGDLLAAISKPIIDIMAKTFTDDLLTIEVHEHKVRIRNEFGVEIQFATWNGNIPDFDKVIPKFHALTVEMERAPLSAACQSAKPVIDGGWGRIDLDIKSDMIGLHSESIDLGIYDTEVECKASGEPMSVSFASIILTKMLRSTTGTFVTLKLAAPNKPVVVLDSGRPDATIFMAPYAAKKPAETNRPKKDAA